MLSKTFQNKSNVHRIPSLTLDEDNFHQFGKITVNKTEGLCSLNPKSPFLTPRQSSDIISSTPPARFIPKSLSKKTLNINLNEEIYWSKLKENCSNYIQKKKAVRQSSVASLPQKNLRSQSVSQINLKLKPEEKCEIKVTLKKKNNIQRNNLRVQKYLKHAYTKANSHYILGKNHKLSQVNIKDKISEAIKKNRCCVVGNKASVNIRLEHPENHSLKRVNSNPERIVLLSQIKEINEKETKPLRLASHDRTKTRVPMRGISLLYKATLKQGINSLNNSSQESLNDTLKNYKMRCKFLSNRSTSSNKIKSLKNISKSKSKAVRSLLARKVSNLYTDKHMSFYQKRMAMMK
ncbi:unnamed protein product [Moneuplotes crassus]|uniref:Uncharacterized protein n=1 Tax=Euplotes crassus TaxID=5936 RepID=A0AAD1X756_EUPCR|nr:unnamed protein product [Moneuplotes crassus]